jgi:hypothetical protein
VRIRLVPGATVVAVTLILSAPAQPRSAETCDELGRFAFGPSGGTFAPTLSPSRFGGFSGHLAWGRPFRAIVVQTRDAGGPGDATVTIDGAAVATVAPQAAASLPSAVRWVSPVLHAPTSGRSFTVAFTWRQAGCTLSRSVTAGTGPGRRLGAGGASVHSVPPLPPDVQRSRLRPPPGVRARLINLDVGRDFLESEVSPEPLTLRIATRGASGAVTVRPALDYTQDAPDAYNPLVAIPEALRTTPAWSAAGVWSPPTRGGGTGGFRGFFLLVHPRPLRAARPAQRVVPFTVAMDHGGQAVVVARKRRLALGLLLSRRRPFVLCAFERFVAGSLNLPTCANARRAS